MIYLDTWNKEYVKEKEVTAPPERYIPYIKGTADGVIIEKYYVGGYSSKRINFAYTEFESTNFPEVVAKKRREHFKNNGVISCSIYAYVIPPAIYDNIEKAVEESKNDLEE
jgi:hypothetical protein